MENFLTNNELTLVQSSFNFRHIGFGDDDVFAHHVEALDVTMFHFLHHHIQVHPIVGRQRNFPRGFEFFANTVVGNLLVARIIDRCRTGIVCTLDIVLASQRIHARRTNAKMTGHQNQICQTINVVRAVGMFGDTQRVVDSGMTSGRVPASGRANIFGRYTGYFFSLFRRISLDLINDSLEILRVSVNEPLVVQTFVDDHVSHRGQQPHVGSGFELQMQIRHLGQPNFSWIRYNQLRAALARSFHFHRNDRMGFGCIGSCNEQHFRIANLINRVGHRTRTKHCHQTGDSRSMSGSGTLMNVVRAECRS